jgi:hypothetical protein
MEGHEERAQEAEYELAEMQEQSDDLADDIQAAKDDWEAKKRDDSVPGARGEAGDEPLGEAVGEDEEEPEAKGAPGVEDENS